MRSCHFDLGSNLAVWHDEPGLLAKVSYASCRFAGVLGVVGIPMMVLSSVAAAGVWTGMAAVLHMVRAAHQINSIH